MSLGIRFIARVFIHLDKAIGNFGQRSARTVFFLPDPSRLKGAPETGSLSTLKTNSWDTEDVGTHLAPQATIASATGKPYFGGMQAEFAKTFEPVTQAERHTFECGASEMGRGEIRER